MSISENVAAIRKRVDAAAIESGRKPEDILLVAATKMNDADRVREAVAAGVDACGENRVQELLEKQKLGCLLAFYTLGLYSHLVPTWTAQCGASGKKGLVLLCKSF